MMYDSTDRAQPSNGHMVTRLTESELVKTDTYAGRSPKRALMKCPK